MQEIKDYDIKWNLKTRINDISSFLQKRNLKIQYVVNPIWYIYNNFNPLKDLLT